MLSCTASLYQDSLSRVTSTTEPKRGKLPGYQVSSYSVHYATVFRYNRGSQVCESTLYDLWRSRLIMLSAARYYDFQLAGTLIFMFSVE